MSTTSPREVVGIVRPIPSTDLPNLEQSARFLTLLDESAERWTFQTFDDNKTRKDPTLARVLHGTLEEHWQTLCDLSSRGAGVFITVNETNGKGRKAADIVRVRTVFQECDRPGTPEPPLQPHIVVESSPGKYHRYLLVEGSHRFDLFEQVMARMMLDFGSDPNAKDRARVLRLPGFPHQKDPTNPRMVRVIHESGERPYSWEEITAAIPPLLIEKKSADVPPGKGIDDPAKVRSALAALDSDMEYQHWLQVGMALHYATAGGAEGLALWDEWSAHGGLYRPGEPAYKWNSFGNTNGRPITLATMFKMASAVGWRWSDTSKDTKPSSGTIALIAGKEPSCTLVHYGEKGPRLVRPSKAAKILAHHRSDRIAYDITARSWLKYTGTHWTELNDDAVFILVANWIDASTDDVGYAPDYVRGTIDLLRARLAIERFDSDPHLVPFINGVLNLKTRQLHGHAPSFHITWCLPFAYDPLATCEPVQAWLLECVNGDSLQVELLRAFLKAVLTGRSDLQRYLELIGPGGGGKGTFTRLAEAIIGSRNTHATSLKRLETNRFETAQLYNARLCVITDSERYAGEVSVLKAMTGQDTLPNERKHQQHGEPFRYRGMVLISGNENIGSADLTSGLQRRRITVRFDNPVAVDQRRDLENEFVPLLPGVVTWCLAMDDERMRQLLVETSRYVPSLAKVAVDTLLATNPIAAWVHECLILETTAETPIGRLEKSTLSTADDGSLTARRTTVEYAHAAEWLYPSYYLYCERVGSKAVANRRFTDLLNDLLKHQLKLTSVEYLPKVSSTPSRFRGIRLRGENDQNAPGVFPCLKTGNMDSKDSKGQQKDSKRTANKEYRTAKHGEPLFAEKTSDAVAVKSEPKNFGQENTSESEFAGHFAEASIKSDGYGKICRPFAGNLPSFAVQQDSKTATSPPDHADGPPDLGDSYMKTLVADFPSGAMPESEPPPEHAIHAKYCSDCTRFYARSLNCGALPGVCIEDSIKPPCMGRFFRSREGRL